MKSQRKHFSAQAKRGLIPSETERIDITLGVRRLQATTLKQRNLSRKRG
jgi:hypothetical protein